MKKITVLFLTLSVLFLTACSDGTTANNELPVVPQFGFGEIQSGRMALNVTSDTIRAEGIYYTICPVLTSFDLDNTESLTTEDSYKMPILGTYITISTEKMDDGTYLFTGVLDDNTGDITVSYDPVDSTFSFEQFFIMSLKEYDYEDGDGTTIDGYANYAIFNKGDNITLNEDGSASGNFYSFHISQYDSDDDPEYTSTLELMGAGIAEFYRGELSPEKGIGTGVALIITDVDSTTFEDSTYLGGHDQYIEPSSDQITEMRDYLENYVSSYESSDTSDLYFSEEGWLLYFQESNSTYYEIQDTIKDDMPSTWKSNLGIQFE